MTWNSGTQYMAYAVELSEGITSVFSSTDTMSRLAVLYHECQFDYTIDMFDSHESTDMDFVITGLHVNASLKELKEVHWAAERLKGHPTRMWEYELTQMMDPRWERIQTDGEYPTGPVLIVHTSEGKGLVFGQPRDLRKVNFFCSTELGITPTSIQRQGRQIVVLEFDDIDTGFVKRHLENISHTVIYREERDFSFNVPDGTFDV